MRIHQEGARARDRLRIAALKIVEMPPEVEAALQSRRQGLLEGRPLSLIVGRDLLQPFELIVERRRREPVVGHQGAGRAMRRDRDRFDLEARADVLERFGEEAPRALGVEPQQRAGRVGGQRRVGARALGQNLAVGVERDGLQVGLADVEDDDRAAH